MSAEPLGLDSQSLITGNDRSHKLIDNCNPIDKQLALNSDNVNEMLSTSSGSSDSTDDDKCQSHLMASECQPMPPMKTLSSPRESGLTANDNKTDRIKECIQQTVSEKTKKRITAIINEIEEFNDIEKLLLYIQLPNGSTQEADPLKQKGPGNPFGKKADVEVAQTYTWIQSHLEEDPAVSLPKQEVYEEYKVFCDANKFEPLCVADFGKAMKHVFPKVKPRRLGQRGNSKYCYSGLRKKVNIEAPELPVLDTSGYEPNKSHVNWDSETNHIYVDDSAADVVISWANRVLGRHFVSMSDLSQYLVGSNSVDIQCDTDRVLSKSSDDKSNVKTNSKSSSTFRRRDVQNQLQRKLHEKEALKKKSDLNFKAIDGLKTTQNCVQKSVRKNRKNSVSKSDEFETINPLNVRIKAEPDTEIMPNLQSNQLMQTTNRLQNKVAIPRTVTPSRMSQPAISTSIIIMPTGAAVRLASPQSAQLTESTTTTTTVSTIATSPLKPNTSKYKRIQPKPVNICRSDSESAVCANSCNEGLESFSSLAKRRHSVSGLLSKDTKAKQMEPLSDKQIQAKRQMDEKDSSLLVTKKRHYDNIQTIVSNSTNSSGFEDANSSNSLSPISQEVQSIANNSEAVSHSEIQIQEMESEPEMEYLMNANQWEPSNGNQTDPQLSQLRKLLENHLPNSVSKLGQQKSGDNIALEGYPELREALLRKNLNNNLHSVQNFGNLKNTSVYSEQSVGNISTNTKFVAKGRQSDSSVQSPDSEGLPSLSSLTKVSETNDFFANQSNDNKSGIYSSFSVQMPSMPQSPTARRRAFNFQPISPRNTPTIPENCAIETIGYNGFAFTSNSAVCSPQYRVNQQTVAVGPSLPPSEANSPFVSPRSTPVTPMTPVTPLPLTRSRHNSGQSNYSALRQTPQQNFDSGVSSISNSPFISPQTTPLPISRVRAATGGAMQRSAISRARHSSGPGGPVSVNGMTTNLLCNRSNSLSPMIGETFLTATHGLPHTLPSNDFISSHLTSFGPNVNPMAAKSRTPNSPLSPMASLNNPDMNGLTSDLMNGSSEVAYNPDCEPIHQNEWPSNRVNNAINGGLVVSRQRHASNPYTTPSTTITTSASEQFNREILSYLRNSGNDKPEAEMQPSNRFLLSRCQSVPAATINPNLTFVQTVGHPLSETHAAEASNQLLDESTNISKSYPATPICSQPFQFPPSPPSSTKQQMAFTGDDIISGNILQSGQDVMVSGVQIRDNSVWSTSIASSQANDNDLMAINTIAANSSTARRNLNDLLAEPPDDLQTTLEDLRDCDNDFSKFAQQLELEANDCTYDDLN